MAKVHEIAKELNVGNKELIEYLNANGSDLKSHMNTLSAEEESKARGKFGEKEAADASKPAKAEAPKAQEAPKAKTEAPRTAIIMGADGKPHKVLVDENGKPIRKKKPEGQKPEGQKKVSVVFSSSQNNKGARPGQGNGQGNGQKRPMQGQGRPLAQDANRPKKVSQRLMQAQEEERQEILRAENERLEAERKQAEAQAQAQAEAAERSERRERPQGDRPQGERRERPQGDRPQGERRERPQGDRPQGERRERPQGDRPQGDRNGRPQGDRNGRPQGDRNGRPQGDRNGRPQGDRNGRPQGDRPQGDRNGRPQGGRPGQGASQSGNFAASGEGSGKNNNNRKSNTNNRGHRNEKQDKEERIINLEKTTGHKKHNKGPQKEERDLNVELTIQIPERLTLKELADKMKVQPSVIVKALFMKGQMVTMNQEIDFATAEEIALEYNTICEPEEKVDVIAELLAEDEEAEEVMTARPPVVCVMGHVDHGKTSLLDAIRNTHEIDREAGGITQAIGAYMVTCNDRKITFLDTPGHEAFTAMRMRGAKSTDIAVLVVAADDGVMPQTVEAINHAKAAGIEIIVAINKIDKPAANIDRVKQELSEYELIPEDWGGSTVFVPVSAKTQEGIDDLLEMILLTADVLELKANAKRRARGLVIEAKLDRGKGVCATVLVQKGTLKVGQPVACGASYGKVRAMYDDLGRNVKEAGPSVPVEIIGLSEVPNAGEIFVSPETEKEARSFAETFITEGKKSLLDETRSRMSLDDLFSQIQAGNVKELELIVKADVQGSVEALKQSLVKLSNEEVVVKIIHSGVGNITESDVILASASNAIIIGFNVRVDALAKNTADSEEVDVRLYNVIYNAIEDIENAMKGMLDPIYEEKIIGHVEIRQIFKASGVGNIAGSYVLDGSVQRDCHVRITRDGDLIHEGKLGSLKRFKDDVKEAKAGYECGLVFEGFDSIQEGDQVEAYIMVEVPRK